MLIDEATSVAVSVSNGDSAACLMVLLPVVHASTDPTVVRRNKRIVEDKLMPWLVEIRFFLVLSELLSPKENQPQLSRHMELRDLTVTFTDPHHAGDKRKKSQFGSLDRFILLCLAAIAVNWCSLQLVVSIPRRLSGLLCVSNIHKEFAFSRSKAAMCGVLGPVQRARVVELVSEDADKPPSPPARAL